MGSTCNYPRLTSSAGQGKSIINSKSNETKNDGRRNGSVRLWKVWLDTEGNKIELREPEIKNLKR